MVEYDIFFPRVSVFVNKVYTDFLVVRIHFAAAFIHREEYRLDT